MALNSPADAHGCGEQLRRLRRRSWPSYFHLTDGCQALIDPDGREIADPGEISALALREARGMISQDAMVGRINLDQYIEVRDADGRLVHQLAFRDAVTISGLKGSD